MDLKDLRDCRILYRRQERNNFCNVRWNFASLRKRLKDLESVYMKEFYGMPTPILENPNAKVGKIEWILE